MVRDSLFYHLILFGAAEMLVLVFENLHLKKVKLKSTPSLHHVIKRFKGESKGIRTVKWKITQFKWNIKEFKWNIKEIKWLDKDKRCRVAI